MIEFRWKKLVRDEIEAEYAPQYAVLLPGSRHYCVLQYRQTKPGLVVQGMEVLGETTDWQDVKISDD